MSEKREEFLKKDFVINQNIIKNIGTLDISLKEFLLILYFINVSLYLNMDDIKNKLGFSDEEIFEIFNSLINKKYIDIKVNNKNGEISEQIVLDTFYDRLILNKKDEEVGKDIFSLFEKELGRTLSSFEYEIMNKWFESNISESIIKEALKEAIVSGVTNFKYIDKIVCEWAKNGVKKRINKEENSEEEIFDYDWLEDNE